MQAKSMITLECVAPVSDDVVDYDRRNLLIYAELLDADDAGLGWREGALDILGIDPVEDPEGARRCWDSHLARARWIVGKGLPLAILAFGEGARSS